MISFSSWEILCFYLWLCEAAVVMIRAAYRGALINRPEICFLIGPLLIAIPVASINIGQSLGVDLPIAVICGLAITWLPMLLLKYIPPRRPRARTYARPAGFALPGGPGIEPLPDDPYSVLGLKPGASLDEITAAWRYCAAQNHPDKVAHLGPESYNEATAQMKRINKAYEALRRTALERVADRVE